MIVLGIETSCDETAISVIECDQSLVKVRSNIISSQVKLHAEFGGVVPNLAAREHVKNIDHVLKSALKEAGLNNIKQIDLISVTRGPGLGPALLIGTTFAKTIAWKNSIPLTGTNHLRGHIHSAWLGEKDKQQDILGLSNKDIYPILSLLVSGGHTELILMNDLNSYSLIGETHDDAIGEAFDKVARLLDLGYPGGPAISKLAETGDENRFKLPLPMIHSGDFNFSFSGLKTAVLYLIKDLRSKSEISSKDKADIAASFQKAAGDVVIAKTIQAAKRYSTKTVILSGGVSANKYIRDNLNNKCNEIGLRCLIPRIEYTTDNAVMIALAGYIEYMGLGKQESQSFTMDPNLTGYTSVSE